MPRAPVLAYSKAQPAIDIIAKNTPTSAVSDDAEYILSAPWVPGSSAHSRTPHSRNNPRTLHGESAAMSSHPGLGCASRCHLAVSTAAAAEADLIGSGKDAAANTRLFDTT